MTRGQPRKAAGPKAKVAHRRKPNELAPVKRAPATPALPQPPCDLDPELHAGWHIIIEDLAGRGRTPASLREVDLVMVRLLLEQVWVHQQATEILHLEGTMLYTKKEIRIEGEPTGEFVTLDAKAHPAVKIQRDAAAQYLRLAHELAIDPMARIQAQLQHNAAGLAETLGRAIAGALKAPAK